MRIRRAARVADETEDEVRLHLALRVESLMQAGMARADAEREALRRFGPWTTARDALVAAARHRERVLTMHDHFDALRHDVASAMRQLRRSPAVAAAIVATFALGIGANATMFGIIDRLLLRPPAHVASPHELASVDRVLTFDGRDVPQPHSYPAYVDLRDNVAGFSHVAMYARPRRVSLGLGPSARAVEAMQVSGNYFQTLGTHTILGRPLLPEDDVLPTGTNVVVISFGLWQLEFGGEPGAVGRDITLAGHPYTIVGVAPRDFAGVGDEPVDVWMPVAAARGLHFDEDWATIRAALWLRVIGRLRPGEPVGAVDAQATAALRAANSAVRGRPDTTTRVTLNSILPDQLTRVTAERRVAVLLGGVSLFVLLIACANVANLLLTRAMRRRREIAVRLALGISRVRLVRQLVIESAALSLLGGVAALAVVYWGSGLIQTLLLSDFAWPASPVDGRVLVFMMVVALVVGVVGGGIPALQASAPDLSRDLKEGSRESGVSRSRTRTALLLSQAALSVVLLAGTGLFVRSLANVDKVDLGLDAGSLVRGTIDLRSVGFDSVAVDRYFRDAAEAVAGIPGVVDATVSSASPMGDWTMSGELVAAGKDSMPDFERGPYLHAVGAGYFSLVGTRILRGREFTTADGLPGAEPVVVLSEATAERLWPGDDALGKCVAVNRRPCARIVGIAENSHINSVGERDEALPGQAYLPFGTINYSPRAYAVIARARNDVSPADLAQPIRGVMQSLRTNLPHAEVQPMWARLDNELRPWRLGATVFGAFGAVALLLSALGLYGVVSWIVVQRTREMGVRLALGARGRHLARLVLSQGLRTVVVGVALGTLIVLGAGKLVESLLFGVSARDPLVLGVAAAVLLLMGALASLIPARRAMHVDPIAALRSD